MFIGISIILIAIIVLVGSIWQAVFPPPPPPLSRQKLFEFFGWKMGYSYSDRWGNCSDSEIDEFIKDVLMIDSLSEPDRRKLQEVAEKFKNGMLTTEETAVINHANYEGSEEQRREESNRDPFNGYQGP